MDFTQAIYKIRDLNAKNGQAVGAYETHISNNMYAADDEDELESQFKSKIGRLKDTVNENVNQVVNVTLSKYPEPYDPNYWHKRECYDVLAQYACAQIDDMNNEFDSTFSRLNNLFRRLSAWIRNKVTQVYTAVKGFFRGAVSRIRRWFS